MNTLLAEASSKPTARAILSTAISTRVVTLIERGGLRRSLVTGAPAFVGEVDVLTVPVGSVAGRSLFCVHMRATLGDLQLHAPRDLDSIPVVDDDLLLRGVVSRFECSQHPSHTHVADVMATTFVSVEENSPLREAFVLMSRKHLRSLPVVTKDGVVRGVVADLDALRWVAEHARRLVRAVHADVA
jgi:CBS domain-containing protein